MRRLPLDMPDRHSSFRLGRVIRERPCTRQWRKSNAVFSWVQIGNQSASWEEDHPPIISEVSSDAAIAVRKLALVVSLRRCTGGACCGAAIGLVSPLRLPASEACFLSSVDIACAWLISSYECFFPLGGDVIR